MTDAAVILAVKAVPPLFLTATFAAALCLLYCNKEKSE